MSSNDTHEINIEPNVRRWAEITLSQFEKKAQALGIHDGALIKSFQTHLLWHSAGNLQKVQFMYNYYGKFVDMGVGRGVKLTDTDKGKRVAKPWFTKTFYKEVEILKHKLAALLAEKVPQIIVERIEK